MSTTLDDNDRGKIIIEGNEVLAYSKIDDPAAYRGGAPENQRSLVKFSGDVLDNGRGQEVVLMQFKQSGDGVPDGQRGGEFYLGLAQPGMGSTDAAMKDMLVVTPEGFEFKAPIHAPNLSGDGGGNEYATGISSRNGRYRLQVQDDGNLVYYDYGMRPPKVLGVIGHQ